MRALDEDTRVSSSFSSSPLDQTATYMFGNVIAIKMYLLERNKRLISCHHHREDV